MDQARIFNRQMAEFIDKLLDLFPDEPNFRGFRFAFNTMSKTLPRKPIEMFNECIAVPYQAQILAHDEAFFVAHDYTAAVGSENMDIVGLLKGYWSGMSPETRAAIWAYCDVFIALCSAYRTAIGQ